MGNHQKPWTLGPGYCVRQMWNCFNVCDEGRPTMKLNINDGIEGSIFSVVVIAIFLILIRLIKQF